MNRRTLIIIILLFLLLIFGFVSVYWYTRQGTVLKSENNYEEKENNQSSKQVDDIQKIPFVSAFDDPAYADDRDRDGISNDDEKVYGTNPDDSDTDGDGIEDKSEIEQYGTDPTNPDTDGDGFWDGLEILNGYDPLN